MVILMVIRRYPICIMEIAPPYTRPRAYLLTLRSLPLAVFTDAAEAVDALHQMASSNYALRFRLVPVLLDPLLPEPPPSGSNGPNPAVS